MFCWPLRRRPARARRRPGRDQPDGLAPVLLANAAGAILWASVIGFGTYFFGRAVMTCDSAGGVSRLRRSPWRSLSEAAFRARARGGAGGGGGARCPVRCGRKSIGHPRVDLEVDWLLRPVGAQLELVVDQVVPSRLQYCRGPRSTPDSPPGGGRNASPAATAGASFGRLKLRGLEV